MFPEVFRSLERKNRALHPPIQLLYKPLKGTETVFPIRQYTQYSSNQPINSQTKRKEKKIIRKGTNIYNISQVKQCIVDFTIIIEGYEYSLGLVLFCKKVSSSNNCIKRNYEII